MNQIKEWQSKRGLWKIDLTGLPFYTGRNKASDHLLMYFFVAPGFRAIQWQNQESKSRYGNVLILSLDWDLDLKRPSFYTQIDSTGGSDSKESGCNLGDPGLIPGLGGFPGEGNGNPFQYSCLENPMVREAWQATIHRAARIGHDLGITPPPPQHKMHQ